MVSSACPLFSEECAHASIIIIVGEPVEQLLLSEELREAHDEVNGDGAVLLKSAVVEGVPLPRAIAGPAGSTAPGGSLHTGPASCVCVTASRNILCHSEARLAPQRRKRERAEAEQALHLQR